MCGWSRHLGSIWLNFDSRSVCVCVCMCVCMWQSQDVILITVACPAVRLPITVNERVHLQHRNKKIAHHSQRVRYEKFKEAYRRQTSLQTETAISKKKC
jgi:transcriptional regulator of met regulon